MLTFFLGIIIIPLAYCLGSIPFGLILTRRAGLGDIRGMGSGNIGATNVMRTAGKKLGMQTFALDAAKGLVAVWIAQLTGSQWVVAFAGAAAALGHIFPYLLGFKGGKGVATTMAVLWGSCWPAGLFASVVWIAMYKFMQLSSVASLSAMILAPAIAMFFASTPVFFMTLLVCAVVIYRHKENIGRLLKGQELPVQK